MKRMSQALEVRRLVDRILDADTDARIVVAGDFNATPDEVPVLAIRGAVEDTGNGELAGRVLVPIENTVPEPARYSLFHQGRPQLLDHMLVTRNLLAHYRGSEIHNEVLHDESAAFADDASSPSPTTGRRRHLRVLTSSASVGRMGRPVAPPRWSGQCQRRSGRWRHPGEVAQRRAQLVGRGRSPPPNAGTA